MKISVIIPSLNPDEKLMKVVNGLIEEGFDDIILVNDGSDKEHEGPFNEAATCSQVTVLVHEVNKGKGRALKTAFEYCRDNRPDIDGVITVDGDNQHLPKDIKACVEAMVAKEDKVILGCRNFKLDNVPPKSKIGNNITGFVFRAFCRIKISDTQTGLRAIPYKYLQDMLDIKGERFEYETRMLLEMKRRGIGFDEVEIETVYIEENASTHFHPFRDSMKIYGVIFRYLFGRMFAFIKYMASSIASFLLDNGIYTLLEFILDDMMSKKIWYPISYGTARVISSLFNFFVNRKVVFKSSASVGKTMLKYYILCVCQLGVGMGIVYLLSEKLGTSGWLTTLLKIGVEACLFILSFQIQKRWVFASDKREE